MITREVCEVVITEITDNDSYTNVIRKAEDVAVHKYDGTLSNMLAVVRYAIARQILSQ